MTGKQLPSQAVVLKPRRSMGGPALVTLFVLLLAAAVAIAGIGLFAPARLAIAHEHALGLIHGGIINTAEETFVDGCVLVPGADTPQAITRTRRVVSYADGTTLEVVFSDRPTPTNACP